MFGCISFRIQGLFGHFDSLQLMTPSCAHVCQNVCRYYDLDSGTDYDYSHDSDHHTDYDSDDCVHDVDRYSL